MAPGGCLHTTGAAWALLRCQTDWAHAAGTCGAPGEENTHLSAVTQPAWSPPCCFHLHSGVASAQRPRLALWPRSLCSSLTLPTQAQRPLASPQLPMWHPMRAHVTAALSSNCPLVPAAARGRVASDGNPTCILAGCGGPWRTARRRRQPLPEACCNGAPAAAKAAGLATQHATAPACQAHRQVKGWCVVRGRNLRGSSQKGRGAWSGHGSHGSTHGSRAGLRSQRGLLRRWAGHGVGVAGARPALGHAEPMAWRSLSTAPVSSAARLRARRRRWRGRRPGRSAARAPLHHSRLGWGRQAPRGSHTCDQQE